MRSTATQSRNHAHCVLPCFLPPPSLFDLILTRWEQHSLPLQDGQLASVRHRTTCCAEGKVADQRIEREGGTNAGERLDGATVIINHSRQEATNSGGHACEDYGD